MVQRMWAEAAGPAGGAEPLFPGSRRSRSVWDAVRLEVGSPDSCPVVLHSFTQLDPDLPRLEVGEAAGRGQAKRGRGPGGLSGSLPRPAWVRGERRVLPQKSPAQLRSQGSTVGAGAAGTTEPTVWGPEPALRVSSPSPVSRPRTPAAQVDPFLRAVTGCLHRRTSQQQGLGCLFPLCQPWACAGCWACQGRW